MVAAAVALKLYVFPSKTLCMVFVISFCVLISILLWQWRLLIYSTANPHVSSTACVSLSSIFSLDSYGGRSNLLKHVCALGKLSVGASIKCRVNRRGPAAPVEPCKALKPCSGTCSIVKWHLITFT